MTIEVSAATPRSAKKPTMTAIEMLKFRKSRYQIPPVIANGSVKKMTQVYKKLFRAISISTKMITKVRGMMYVSFDFVSDIIRRVDDCFGMGLTVKR